MPEHFNASVGEHVTSRRGFLDALDRKSEEMTARTGVEHRYAPIDPGDRKSLGVSEEAVDRARERRIERGAESRKVIVGG